MSTADWCPSESSASTGQDRRRLIGGCVPSALEHLGWQPLTLTGVVRWLLIRHFASASHIEHPDLQSAVWSAGANTGILIESVNRFRPDAVEKRPAALIKRNPYRNMRFAIQDAIGVDDRGFRSYATLWVGSHTVFCLHGTAAAAEILATEVQRELTQFGPAVVTKYGLHKFQVTEVGIASEVEEATENYLVPVNVGWAYQETWRLEPEALTLQGIDLNVSP